MMNAQILDTTQLSRPSLREMKLLKPIFIDIDIESVEDLETEPAFYDESCQDFYSYWTDGQQIYWGELPLKVDMESFGFYNHIFAKDKRHCFLQGKKLQGANATAFRALNECFAKDDRFVWTTGGRFEPADIDSFEVCDDGLLDENTPLIVEFTDGISRNVVTKLPYGYARDSQYVYYENFKGKIKILKKANPSTFISLNDGYFAKDDQHIFFEQYALPKANPATWQKIDSFYSKDDKSVYFTHKRLDADLETFELEPITDNHGITISYPKDKHGYFLYDERISKETLMERINQSYEFLES